MKKIIYFVLALFTLTFSKAQTVDLKLNLEAGKEYRQVLNSNVTVIQELNGQKIEIAMSIKGTISYKVISVDERGYELETKYEKLTMKMNLPQGDVEYNSEIDNVNDIMSTFLNKMSEKSFEVVMSKTGKVLEIKNMDALWESVLSQFDQLSAEQKKQLLAQVTNTYGDKSFRSNLEMSSAIYPDRPVNKGDKWSIDTDLETTMSAKMTTEYTFMDLTPEYAIIKGNAKIFTQNKDYIESNGMNVKYDLSGTTESDIKVDISSGWVIESKISQMIKGNASFKENGMTVPMTIINEMTITNQ